MVIGGLWPVVQRELREAARRPLNRRLRFIGAAFAVFILWRIIPDDPRLTPSFANSGMAIFSRLDVTLTFLILFLLPTLTADCIARERREGTLGLLFLTPLTASEIVTGKAMSQVLRVFLIWLGALPILCVSFICGCVEPTDILTLILIHGGCACIALSAGLLGSSIARGRTTAYVLAFLFLAIFAGLFHELLSSLWGPASPFYIGKGQSSLSLLFARAKASGYSANHPAIEVLLWENILAIGLLWISIRLGGWCIQRHWRDNPPSARKEKFAKRYCRPILEGSFRRKMRNAMTANPIAWLQQYSWKARAAKWSLCLLFVFVESFFGRAHNPIGFAAALFACMLVLLGAFTFSAVNGFYADKKSGALELILVTPMSIEKIVLGRALGFWKLYFPSVSALIGCNLYFSLTTHAGLNVYPISSVGFVCGNLSLINVEILFVYLTLPVIASYLTLTLGKPVWASIFTFALGLAPMWLLYVHACVAFQISHGPEEFNTQMFLLVLTSPVSVMVLQALMPIAAFHQIRLGQRWLYRFETPWRQFSRDGAGL